MKIYPYKPKALEGGEDPLYIKVVRGKRDHYVDIVVCNTDGIEVKSGGLCYLAKDGMFFYTGVSAKLGFALDDVGRLKVNQID